MCFGVKFSFFVFSFAFYALFPHATLEILCVNALRAVYFRACLIL